MYLGARFAKLLKTRRPTLKVMRSEIGSQCKLCSTGVMCWRLLVLVTRRAAEFCTICNACNSDLVEFTKIALQKSSLEVTNACTTISAAELLRKGRICHSWRNWLRQVAVRWAAWSLKLNSESSVTPRLRTELATLMGTPPRVTVSISIADSRWREPKKII